MVVPQVTSCRIAPQHDLLQVVDEATARALIEERVQHDLRAAYPCLSAASLWDLLGDEGGEPHEVLKGFEQVEAGSLSEEEYESFVRDLTNFMAYMAEPMRLERERLGIKVLAFLTVMFILTYALKKEFWKDVH